MNTIIANRLYIKPYIDEYMEDIIKLYLDTELHKYQCMHNDSDEVIKFILQMNRYFDQSYGIMGIKCIFLHDHTLIGVIPIFPYFDKQSKLYLEIGIVINKNYHNQGFATEALNGLISYYFKICFLPNVYKGFYSQTRNDNIACQHVLSKVGFNFYDVIDVECDEHIDYSYIIKIEKLKS